MLVFGKRGYSFAAFNLAVSLKHYNPEIKIAVAHDSGFKNHLMPGDLSIFDHLIEIPDDLIRNEKGKIDPGKIKCSMYEWAPFDENLYLDVDAIAVQDIQPLIDQLSAKEGYYFTDVLGMGKKDDKINYSIWANNEDIWEFFNLTEESNLVAIQSSFCYFKKNDEAKEFFDAVKANFERGFPKDKALLWGGTIPDELIFSGTIAQFGIDPTANVSPIFFGNNLDVRTFQQIDKDHYLISMFGNGDGGKTLTKLRYIERYDKLMFRYCSERKMNHRYKIWYIMQDKHANVSNWK